jgi:hypothetical protein
MKKIIVYGGTFLGLFSIKEAIQRYYYDIIRVNGKSMGENYI